MPTDLELPPVAHIVAELEEYEPQEFDIAHLAVEPWVTPTRSAQVRGSRAHFTIAALIALAVAGGR